ncbi:hypothetical protein QBC47DRAFT_367633 [Echria macrotheca]|uniref:MYND-type domain-containing protein n=1 Tax=Echria macrotheca TaxID=438768 RepID=A0AAJ0BMA8_9PEZI|nr:hypothetical protein QBC47DRAFT_367633 [Echria macrotheca]
MFHTSPHSHIQFTLHNSTPSPPKTLASNHLEILDHLTIITPSIYLTKMPLPNFKDETTFPTFTACPSHHPLALLDKDYFLLAQVKDDMTITKPTLVLTDRSGAPFALVFDGLDRDALDLKKLGLRKGNTAVIPRAVRTPPREEGKRGFVSVPLGSAGDVRAIPGPLERVLAVGERLNFRENGDEVEEEEGCAGCGEREKELMRCTGCGGVRYCSKECQVKGWADGHKGECKVIKAIREIWGE